MEAPPRLELGIKVLQTSALPLGYGAIKLIENTLVLSIMWSGLRDSNSLPSPWQGDALPDELNPQLQNQLYRYLSVLSRPKFIFDKLF